MPLDEALALAHEQGPASLVDMIERTREQLTCTTYSYPGRTIGPLRAARRPHTLAIRSPALVATHRAPADLE
jgi:hypothetical protein